MLSLLSYTVVGEQEQLGIRGRCWTPAGRIIVIICVRRDVTDLVADGSWLDAPLNLESAGRLREVAADRLRARYISVEVVRVQTGVQSRRKLGIGVPRCCATVLPVQQARTPHRLAHAMSVRSLRSRTRAVKEFTGNTTQSRFCVSNNPVNESNKHIS